MLQKYKFLDNADYKACLSLDNTLESVELNKLKLTITQKKCEQFMTYYKDLCEKEVQHSKNTSEMKEATLQIQSIKDKLADVDLTQIDDLVKPTQSKTTVVGVQQQKSALDSDNFGGSKNATRFKPILGTVQIMTEFNPSKNKVVYGTSGSNNAIYEINGVYYVLCNGQKYTKSSSILKYIDSSLFTN